MARPYKCPWCGESGKSVSKGVRKTKTMGNRRIKLCKACGRKFTPKNQKPAELSGDKVVEASAAPDGAPAACVIAEPNAAPESNKAAVEPTDDSKPLLHALDKEWTS